MVKFQSVVLSDSLNATEALSYQYLKGTRTCTFGKTSKSTVVGALAHDRDRIFSSMAEEAFKIFDSDDDGFTTRSWLETLTGCLEKPHWARLLGEAGDDGRKPVRRSDCVVKIVDQLLMARKTENVAAMLGVQGVQAAA